MTGDVERQGLKKETLREHERESARRRRGRGRDRKREWERETEGERELEKESAPSEREIVLGRSSIFFICLIQLWHDSSTCDMTHSESDDAASSLLFKFHVTHKWILSHVNWSCCKCERVMSHIWMSYVTYSDDAASFLLFKFHVTHEWIMSQVNESCCKCERVMSHIWMSHVTHMHESFHIFRRSSIFTVVQFPWFSSFFFQHSFYISVNAYFSERSLLDKTSCGIAPCRPATHRNTPQHTIHRPLQHTATIYKYTTAARKKERTRPYPRDTHSGYQFSIKVLLSKHRTP